MLDMHPGNRRNQNCEGVSRRDFVRGGALGALGLSFPGLLTARAGAAAPPNPGTAVDPSPATSGAHAPRAKSVLLVFLGGGISHHDTFDMKPDAAEEIRGKYTPIPTNVTGLRVGELLPRMAKTMDKVCLVRSQTHESDHHQAATNWVLSGRSGSPFGDHPSIGAVVAHETGFAGPLPPYVAVPRKPSFIWGLGTSSWLGRRYEAFETGDPTDKGFRVRYSALPEPRNPRQPTRRESLLAAVGNLNAKIQGGDRVAADDESRRRRREIGLPDDAWSAFDVNAEADDLRDRYGRSAFGQGCLLARRLIERGVRFAQVNFGGWDHHANIWSGLEEKCPDFDAGFATLIEDMYDRGLLDETLVVCMGEFGRTPKVNADAGRDHWGRAGSMLFAGAGVQGGRVIGATDKDGASVTDRPCRPADVAWTIYDALGIDPRKQIQTPDGRSIEILSEGSRIDELYA